MARMLLSVSAFNSPFFSYWDEMEEEQDDEKPDSPVNVEDCPDGGGGLLQQVAAIALEEPVPLGPAQTTAPSQALANP
ncbi:unnamed protein product [Darwinula stevensoni]|uniref:Uncharacterized protein n=1 Tax=Darwinula stevensoni TaxID=69355 RepID=A0A7R9AHS7_9CRUS|nr:unnamed protein product [Darwinula stevensoni]CAG0905355.1 unnamed protein product [Darwinula stevensoni]